MTVSGIICEYNPFHNGHKYLIDVHKKNHPGGIIAVMSGSFTQRGQAALLDKWTRAALAIHGGADLVIELPACFAVRSAEHFARGALQLLERLGVVDTLCFGSETSDAESLQKLALFQLSEEFNDALQEQLQSGISYAGAVCKTLSRLSSIDEAVLRSPNLILGMEYIKNSYDRYQKRFLFDFDVIQRISAAHNSADFHGGFASGTAVRQLLYNPSADTAESISKLKEALPVQSFAAMQSLLRNKAQLPQQERLFLPLMARLRLTNIQSLSNIYGIKEGLEHKLMLSASDASSLDMLLKNVKSKRYPLTSLQRLMLYLLFNITYEQMAAFDASGPLYARVLAFNETGRGLLRRIKSSGCIPLITKTSAHLSSRQWHQADELTKLQKMLLLDVKATELYNLCFAPVKPSGSDFLTSPLYIKS